MLVGTYGVVNQYCLKMVGGPVGGFLADKKFKSPAKYLRVAFAVAAVAMAVIIMMPHESLNVYTGMTMTTYFASYDETDHEVGVHGKEALKAIQEIDKFLGELVKKANDIANDNIVVCVVSDHGTINNVGDIRPNTLLYKNKLIEINENGKVIDWDAWCQRSGELDK